MARICVLLLAALAAALGVLPAAAQARAGELRGAWMGAGYGRDWSAIMRSLHENGFNALFPNLCTGGAAWYPSKVLPAAAGATKGRDELAEAVKAAKQHGIELHVWRINWMTEGIPADVLKQYEKDGRLMRNAKGQLVRDDPEDPLKMDWLCPSHPANRSLEKEAMLEVARKYDVAGLQFDYMRFPSRSYCFCDHCKEQFTRDTGLKPERWPDDVMQGGKLGQQYEEWRWGLQTSLVREISQEAHRIKPEVKVSLAAWPDLEVARHGVLQDWPAWVKNGSLDFICFRDYAQEAGRVSALLAPDVDLIAGAIPIYAGLGAFQLKEARALISQIAASREAGADGFVAFAYASGDLSQWLPEIHLAAADTDPDPMPHWSPPVSLHFSGPALDPSFSGRQVKMGAPLSVDIKLGEAVEIEDTAGLAQAASVLSRAAGSRQPMESYDTASGAPRPNAGYRLSGQVVVEDPQGRQLAKLAVFESDQQYSRTMTFSAPRGRFRFAIYGKEQLASDRIRAFVTRGPVLTGVAGAPPPASRDQAEVQTPKQVHAELARVFSSLPNPLAPTQLEGAARVVRIHATGSGGGDWWVRLGEGKCVSGEGVPEHPDLTIDGSAQDLLSVVQRRSDPRTLWAKWRLTVAGDFSLVGKLLQLLGLDPEL